MKTLHCSKIIAVALLLIYAGTGCKKRSNKPAHYDELTGTKTWHHAYTSASPYAPYHTTDTLADQVLTIVGLNDATIARGTDTLTYNAAKSINDILFFQQTGNQLHFRTISYNSVSHVTIYYREWHVSAGAGEASETYYQP